MASTARYSRFVALVKVALPLLALVLLSSLFLAARQPGEEGASGLTTRDVVRIARDQRLDNAVYTAVTDTGGSLVLSARTAVPRTGTEVVDVTGLDATLHGTDGRVTTLAAETGAVDRAARSGAFSGDVRVATSDGYRLFTEALTASFDGDLIRSDVPVRVLGPRTTITADRMEARAGAVGPAGVVVFKGGVRLVYVPQAAGPEAAGNAP
jgi:lipopolysaccharide export system protein LptC